jgi:hypothetical protein
MGLPPSSYFFEERALADGSCANVALCLSGNPAISGFAASNAIKVTQNLF